MKIELDFDICECGEFVNHSGLTREKMTCSRCGLMKWNGSTSTWATQEVFELRKQAHALFDPIWRSGTMTRKELYAWLGKDKHFGQMQKEELEYQIKRLKELKVDLTSQQDMV